MKRPKSNLQKGLKFHLKEQFHQKLKFFEPVNASKRIIAGLSKSVEKAYLDISNTQERFNSEREKLREGLSESVRYSYDPLLFLENKPMYRNLIKEFIAPEIYKKPKSKLFERPFSESRLHRREFDTFEEMIDQCRLIKANTSSMKKKLPKVSKTVQSSYELVKKLTIKPEVAKLERLVTSLKRFYN